MAAYNYEQFVERAIQSALDQDYPPELLEVVVIDDGSTDSTADVVRALAERNPGRVRLIQQPNGGYVAATNRALAEGTGEMLALLDADDMWLPAKTRQQVEMLQAQPEVGMVFSDMVVVDGDEQTVRPSLIWAQGELPERQFARVLHENVATQSSIMIRRALRDHVAPIPPEITYADWWITLRSAQHSRLDYSREPLALYRVHGSNLTGDVTGAGAVREASKAISFQLWALRNLALDRIDALEATYVWDGIEREAQRMMEAAETSFVALAEPVPGADVDGLLAQADGWREEGELDLAAELTLRALAADPFVVGTRERLTDTTARARAAAELPDPLAGAEGYIVIADAEELLASDDLLTAWADAIAGPADITLAIDATRMPEEAAGAELQALVQRCGLAERDDIALVAVVGARTPDERYRMLRSARARYTRQASDGDATAARRPVFTPATLPDLVARAAGF